MNQKVAKETAEKTKAKKIFVGGMSKLVQEEDLVEYFSLFGPVEKATVTRNHATNESRGCGFVVFKME